MTDQFNTQIGRLMGVYGKKNFQSEARLAMIWDIVRDLDYAEFLPIVDYIIANCRNAPLPQDFREAVKGIKRYGERAVSPAPPPQCRYCLDSGLVNVKHNLSKRDLFMNCPCPGINPESYRLRPIHTLPKWNKSLEREFTMIPFDPLYWKPKRFNPKDPEGSLRERAEEWKLRIKISQVFWKEHFAKSNIQNNPDKPDGAA